MGITRNTLKTSTKLVYVGLAGFTLSIWIRHSIPWYEMIMPLLCIFLVQRMTRIYSLTDGMLHNMVKEKLQKLTTADSITDKVLGHTHKKSNKRYRVKRKKTSRRN